MITTSRLVESMIRVAEVTPEQLEQAGCDRIVLPGEIVSRHDFSTDYEHARFNALSIVELTYQQPYEGLAPRMAKLARPALHRSLRGINDISKMKKSETRFEGSGIIRKIAPFVIHFAARYPNTWVNENPHSVSPLANEREITARNLFYLRHMDDITTILRKASMPLNGDVVQTLGEIERLRHDRQMSDVSPKICEYDGETVVSLFD